MGPNCSIKRHILVVDDEPLVLEAVAMLLKFDGHEVHSATSGQEALAVFKPGKFDIVITDFFMPAMTGGQLAAAIKSHSPSQPVVLLTAYGERFRCSNQRLREVDMVMDKPLAMGHLREAITRFSPAQNLDAVLSQN
jgi:CheY-like chemotaxis protein